jgi:uncharacterized protein (UPF0179 family)
MGGSSALTFVGKSFARKGFRFYYEGRDPQCPPQCKLNATCQANLQPNQVYIVTQVLDKIHACPYDLHEEEMVLVKVGIPETIVSMENKEIFEGSIVSYQPIACDVVDCPHHEYCVPELIVKPKDRLFVKERVEKIKDCRVGKSLSKVKVEKK